jgi:hypothetical protein
VRSRLFQRTGLKYRGEHAVRVHQHVIVPESEHPKAASLQPLGSVSISASLRLIRMLAAVKFDDEAAFSAAEVGYEISNRELPPESEAV